MTSSYVSSRYYNQVVDYIQLEENGDIKPIVFYQFDDLYNKTYTIYEWSDTDKLWSVSYKYFGRPDLWWAIVEYNPEIKDFMNITPGTPIRIPNV